VEIFFLMFSSPSNDSGEPISRLEDQVVPLSLRDASLTSALSISSLS
jgi:hypothetical protein